MTGLISGSMNCELSGKALFSVGWLSLTVMDGEITKAIDIDQIPIKFPKSVITWCIDVIYVFELFVGKSTFLPTTFRCHENVTELSGRNFAEEPQFSKMKIFTKKHRFARIWLNFYLFPEVRRSSYTRKLVNIVNVFEITVQCQQIPRSVWIIAWHLNSSFVVKPNDLIHLSIATCCGSFWSGNLLQIIIAIGAVNTCHSDCIAARNATRVINSIISILLQPTPQSKNSNHLRKKMQKILHAAFRFSIPSQNRSWLTQKKMCSLFTIHIHLSIRFIFYVISKHRIHSLLHYYLMWCELNGVCRTSRAHTSHTDRLQDFKSISSMRKSSNSHVWKMKLIIFFSFLFCCFIHWYQPRTFIYIGSTCKQTCVFGVSTASAATALHANIIHVTVFAMTNLASDRKKKNWI